MNKPETTAGYLCPETAGSHHYHTDKHQFYVGTTYLALCCHCGRVQIIIYRGRKETPDLISMGGPDCGSYYR